MADDAGPSGGGGAPDFTGKGELLEADDRTVFKTVDDLVLRQEPLARNRLAQDKHWTFVKLGYPWSCLEKQQDQDIFTQSFPPGTGTLRPSAVPNKQADLCQKLREILCADPALPETQAENDSEDAERGAEICRQFLERDGGEAGTNDAALFSFQVEAATVRSSAFNHYWVDQTGGGRVAQQIKAHPQATDPEHPFDAMGADGQPVPTTDYILRYVTAANPETGTGAQFTDDPSQANFTWLPRIRVEKWGREHWRFFPEDKDLHGCQSAVGLLYCTLGEAKRRWKSVADLSPEECGTLCDWSPPRYLALLPPALRARWKLQTGSQKDPKGGSNDERVMFYYVYYRVGEPAYPEGAALFTTGAFGGMTLDKDTLSATVQMPSQEQQDKQVTDLRPMDIPLVQVRLLPDTDEKDPTGTPFMRRIGGAGEALSTLASSYLEAIDIILHPARFATSTSPITADDVEQSRAVGNFATVLTKEDFPVYETPRALPPSFLEVSQWQASVMEDAAGLPRAATGSNRQQEVSGVARQAAIHQAQQQLSSMNTAINVDGYERHYRIKCQLAMKWFTVPQLIRYTGEDGAYKQEWFTGNDFAVVASGITVRKGTGTMMSQQDKVTYMANLKKEGFVDTDEALDTVRPAFQRALGIDDNPHQQRVERQVSSWDEGPPEGWEQAYAAYVEAKQQYDQMAAAQAQAAQLAQRQNAETAAAVGIPAPAPAPAAPLPPPPTPPWTPFQALPMDDEPTIASIRKRRLSRLMATVRFSAQSPAWQQMVKDAYNTARQAVALAAQAATPPALPKGVTIAAKADGSNIAQEEQAALQGFKPQPPKPAGTP